MQGAPEDRGAGASEQVCDQQRLHTGVEEKQDVQEREGRSPQEQPSEETQFTEETYQKIEEAVNAVYSVMSYMRRYAASDFDDIVQNTCVQVYRYCHKRGIDPNTVTHSSLFKLARYEALRVLNRRTRMNTNTKEVLHKHTLQYMDGIEECSYNNVDHDQSLLRMTDDGYTLYEDLTTQDMRKHLRKRLEVAVRSEILNKRGPEIFDRAAQGRDSEEIVEGLGISVNGMRTMLSRHIRPLVKAAYTSQISEKG